MNDHALIYDLWHEYASTKNVESLIELYSSTAIFESPLVPILMKGLLEYSMAKMKFINF